VHETVPVRLEVVPQNDAAGADQPERCEGVGDTVLILVTAVDQHEVSRTFERREVVVERVAKELRDLVCSR
jgi:hypothetical protein